MESLTEGTSGSADLIWRSSGGSLLFGAKLIYIEIYDRIDKPTMTGKMVYPIVDKFIVQWEEQKKVYPKAINLGSIF